MFKKNKQRYTNKKEFLFQISITLLGLIIIILICIPLTRKIKQRYQIKKEIVGLQNEIQKLEEKNNHLEQIVDYLESDQFIEEQARLKLGLKKEGEEVVVIEGNTKATNTHEAVDTIYNISGLNKNINKRYITFNNPKKWLKYFLGH